MTSDQAFLEDHARARALKRRILRGTPWPETGSAKDRRRQPDWSEALPAPEQQAGEIIDDAA